MVRLEFERKLRELKHGQCRPLKCRGTERGEIDDNDGVQIIRVRTGRRTNKTKPISYEMMLFAFDRIMSGQRFDSQSFQAKFQDEYDDGPCIYSTVGGIVVEWRLADRFPCGGNSCYYEKVKSELP